MAHYILGSSSLSHYHSAYAQTEPEEEEFAFLMEGVAELRLAESHSRKRSTLTPVTHPPISEISTAFIPMA